MSGKKKSLENARVFVLEDETLVAMMIEDMLDALGCAIVGPFARLHAAEKALSAGETADVALLDVNVGGARSYPVAEALEAAGVPFVFTTGYDTEGLPEKWRDRPTLRKPFMSAELERTLRAVLEG